MLSNLHSGAILSVVIAGLLWLAPGNAPAQDVPSSDITNAEAETPEECDSGEITPLSLVRPWLAPAATADEEIRCLEIRLKKGELVRGVIETEARLPWAGVHLDLVPPAGDPPLSGLFVQRPAMSQARFSWVAEEEGPHFLVVREVWRGHEFLPPTLTSIPVRVWIESIEPPVLAAARAEALVEDPRVEWLRENVVELRSISPRSDDYGDLEPLREALKGVRLVLLGEANHGSGSDFLARSRLVKFLHGELGFDVLAFESGLYGMTVARDSLRAGVPAREAFGIGAFGFWRNAEQMQPLLTYLGEQAGEDRPLELAGFDNRPWLWEPQWPTSVPRFARDLRRFLADRDIQGPLTDPDSPEYGILEALSARRYDGREADLPIPESSVRTDFHRAVKEAVGGLEARPDEDSAFWSEALRGVGCHARDQFGELPWEGEAASECHRDHQMAEHLIWLANERYPDRKIIAWAHTCHVMRTAEYHDSCGIGPTMGHRLRDALDEEAYAIGTTSYQGFDGYIVRDQHPLPELEQLLEVAGFDYGFLDLRSGARNGSWIGGPFLARPALYLTEEAVWSDRLDALLFIREQEPRRQIEVEPDAAGGMP